MARDLEIPAKDLVAKFQELGHEVKNQFAWVEESAAEAVKKALAEVSAAPAAPAEAPSVPAPAARVESRPMHAPGAPLPAHLIAQRPAPPPGVSMARAGAMPHNVAVPQAPVARTGPPGAPGLPPTVAVPQAPGGAPGAPASPSSGAGFGLRRPPTPATRFAIRADQRPDARRGEAGAPGATPGRDPKTRFGRDGKPERDERRLKDQEGDLPGKVKARKKSKAEMRAEREERRARRQGGDEAKPEIIELVGSLTVKELAEKMKVKETEVIKKLFMRGIMATINQTIEKETAEMVAEEMGYLVDLVDPIAKSLEAEKQEEEEHPDLLRPRPPVVTIMGHVDHGKTSLLDALRQARVADGEAGGITQHIGAYMTSLEGREIAFLDTPGHEAFTAMRARGAKATDVVVLVVAADDGVMPQTVEAIGHAKAANVPIIVAINKIDKPGADPNRVKQELTEHNLVAEEWGGQTIMVEVSAKKKLNLDKLMEMILLQAEILELRANPERMARGLIIEAKLSKGMGPVATVLVQNGTLRVGDPFVVGGISGRVRALVDDRGRRVKEAGPSHPVEVLGLSDVPSTGDTFQVMASDKEAKAVADERATADRAETLARRGVTLQDFYRRIQEGQKELAIVLKADMKGSSEAIEQALSQLNQRVEGATIRILLSGNGDISEYDVNLATASDAMVIGFNVKLDTRAERMADDQGVEVRTYSVIYKMIEELELAMQGMLEPEYETVLIGKAEVRATFKSGKTTVIAGCMVTEGKIERKAQFKVLRGTDTVHEGKLDSLKRFKDDVKEVATGYECGLLFDKWNDAQEGDVIEAYITREKERKAS